MNYVEIFVGIVLFALSFYFLFIVVQFVIHMIDVSLDDTIDPWNSSRR